MSSEDGDGGYHHQQSSGGGQQPHPQSTLGVTGTRKRTPYGPQQSHYSSQQQQQQPPPSSSLPQHHPYKDALERNSSSCSSYIESDHGGNYQTSASPSRFYAAENFILSGRLSTVTQDKYDESLSCCLPPPSPAPASDRFIMGIPSPSPTSGHYPDRYTLHHRIMSPSSRFRTSLPDRYRDISPKCDRLVTPVHYLANATPLASNENSFAYMSSSVHTPVKRYVPTPPTPENDTCSSTNGGFHLPGPSHMSIQSSQQVPKLLAQPNNPYAFRLKCCPPDQAQPQATISPRATPPVSTLDGTDHYATPACGKHIKAGNGTATLGRIPRQPMCPVNMARAPSVEYIGTNGARVLTPVSFVSESGSNCLHCSTLRRATGIHQTTQTTGPISPTTQPQIVLAPSQPDMDMCDKGLRLPPSGPVTYQSLTSQQQQQLAQQLQQQQLQPPPMSPQPQQLQTPPQPTPSSPQASGSKQEPMIVNNPSNRSLVIQHQYRESPSSTMSSLTTLQRAGLAPRQSQRIFQKQKIKEYLKRETARFFGVDTQSEDDELVKWTGRYNRLAFRRFGRIRDENEENHTEPRPHSDRPDILPEQSNDETTTGVQRNQGAGYRKDSVVKMAWNGMSYVIKILSKKRHKEIKQWSRSFAPNHINTNDESDLCEGLTPIQEDETFFDILNNACRQNNQPQQQYMSERVNGWRIKSTETNQGGQGMRGARISFRLLDGVLDNSRRPSHKLRFHRHNLMDDRYDHRPFFTYWINTVHILIMVLTLVCYGIGPIGFGVEQKTGQVLVTSLSLQQVTHAEYRNIWIGPRDTDLVHLGAKFAACMRRDHKILQVMAKTRRQERETACCIRNDDSGCVQSSQADCSVRGLFPTSISTWKKWSPGDSGPGGRISGSVCGLDPKFCDAPASIAPYEWPDDITKWPICRKTNSFPQRFRFKDHTAEHMVCEVIGHPCCISVYGDCRITTREYCDFVHGYFHEEASLCSQISCLNDVCGMLPFISTDIPDQFYRLFTSLCLHAGILHLAITVAFQHTFLADLERLIGPLRTAIIYIGSGIAGNLTSALLVPYKTEVGPLSSFAGVTSSLCVMLTFYHWKRLKKPHLALVKMLIVMIVLFALGTLPWQQNFAALIVGSVFGVILTLTIVPFLSITKFNRKGKINLIWTCLTLHLTIYTTMFIIFYLFPNLFSSLEFTSSEDLNADNHFNVFGGISGGGTAIARSGQSVSMSMVTNNNLAINNNDNNINTNNNYHNIGNGNTHNPLSTLNAFFYRKERH